MMRVWILLFVWLAAVVPAIPAWSLAVDNDNDNDVDGSDLQYLSQKLANDLADNEDLKEFAENFGYEFCRIAGQVHYNDVGLEGATVTLHGNSDQSTATDSSGLFEFERVIRGSYTIEPAYPSFLFEPSAAEITPDYTPGELIVFSAYGHRPGSFVPLGTLNITASEVSIATGTSADGTYVVGYTEIPFESLAFRWDARDGMTSLGHISNDERFGNEAYGVSADGQTIVGWSEFWPVVSSHGVAFIWTPEAGMKVLNTGWNGTALDVSDDGKIKSGWRGGEEKWRGSCFWDASNQDFAFGPFSPFCSGASVCRGQASSISADGSLLIGNLIAWDYYYPREVTSISYLYNRLTKAMRYISLTDPYSNARANDLSADGTVVVGSTYMQYSGTQPFRWTVAEGLQIIGAPSGVLAYGNSTGVSRHGSRIVGYLHNYGNNLAFIWDEVNGIRVLKDELIDAGIAEVSDWALTEATDISDDGNTIVGYGINPQGKKEAWLVKLP